MAVYYVDFSGSAGSGNGTSFANRASLIKNISNTTLTAGTDEIRCKGNPITSLGTAKIVDRQYPTYGNVYNTGDKIVYSTSAGQTYIKDKLGFQTGDRILISEDNNAASLSQPSLLGLHSVTVNSNYPDRIYIDGYTASSNLNGSGYSSTRFSPLVSDIIEMNTANLTREIASMEFDRAAWTGVSGVTTSLDSWYSQSDFGSSVNALFSPSDKISVPSSQSVGKIAHYQLPSTLDLSGYQQISFMVKSSAGGFSTADSIRLCTDTGGNTSVHTATIQLRDAGSDDWIASVTDLGANMNSSIKSIALYREATQSSACDYRFQNIIACKDSSDADAITHQSLIGLNASIPIWYNIAFIKGDLVCVKALDNHRGNKSNYYNGGYGAKWTTTGNAVAVYKVEPFLLSGITSNTYEVDKLNNSTSGVMTDNNFVTISGGWNATDMSSKSGATIIQGNGRGRVMFEYKYKLELKDLSWHSFYSFRFYGNYQPKFTGIGLSSLHDTSYQDWGYNKSWKGLTMNYLTGFRSYLRIYDTSQAASASASDFNFNYIGNSNDGYFQITRTDPGSSYYPSKNWIMNDIDKVPDRGYSMQIYDFDNVEINSIKLPAGNTVYFNFYRVKEAIIQSIESSCQLQLSNQNTKVTINSLTHTLPLHPTSPTTVFGKLLGFQVFSVAIEGTGYTPEVLIASGSLMAEAQANTQGLKLNGLTRSGAGAVRSSNSTGPVFWRNYNNTSGDHRSYYGAHLITQESSTVHTSGGKCLKAQVLSTTETAQQVPLGSIMVNANSAVTISIYVYITGSNEQVTLLTSAAPWLGLSASQAVTADTSSGTSQNTWTQITKTFTPTATGKLNISLDLSNNSTSSVMFVDDFGVSQA